MYNRYTWVERLSLRVLCDQSALVVCFSPCLCLLLSLPPARRCCFCPRGMVAEDNGDGEKVSREAAEYLSTAASSKGQE